MKKTVALLSGLLVGVSAFAAGLSQLTLSISTPGPDLYADGTLVLTGETYLLVYVKAGSSFQGVLSDGTLVDPVNNVVVTKSYAVAGAKCGFKAIQYPASLYPDGGSWVIVLLDTRTPDGAVGGLVAAQGATDKTGAASGESTSLQSLGASSSSGGGAVALSASTLSVAPADTPVPVITGVDRGAGTASIRFKNFSDKALYEVQTTTDLASGQWTAASNGTRVQTSGRSLVMEKDGSSALPVSVSVPSDDTVRFFRVIVPSAK